MELGKHSETNVKIKKLNDIIADKNKELESLKNNISDLLQKIRDTNEQNDYNDPSVKKRKISELCTEKIYELRNDLFINNQKKEPSISDQTKNR